MVGGALDEFMNHIFMSIKHARNLGRIHSTLKLIRKQGGSIFGDYKISMLVMFWVTVITVQRQHVETKGYNPLITVMLHTFQFHLTINNDSALCIKTCFATVGLSLENAVNAERGKSFLCHYYVNLAFVIFTLHRSPHQHHHPIFPNWESPSTPWSLADNLPN